MALIETQSKRRYPVLQRDQINGWNEIPQVWQEPAHWRDAQIWQGDVDVFEEAEFHGPAQRSLSKFAALGEARRHGITYWTAGLAAAVVVVTGFVAAENIIQHGFGGSPVSGMQATGGTNVGSRARYEQGSLAGTLNDIVFGTRVQADVAERGNRALLRQAIVGNENAAKTFSMAYAESGQKLDAKLSGDALQLSQFAYAALQVKRAHGTGFLLKLQDAFFNRQRVAVPADREIAEEIGLIAAHDKQITNPVTWAALAGRTMASYVGVDDLKERVRYMAEKAISHGHFKDAGRILADLRAIAQHPSVLYKNLRSGDTLGQKFGMTDRAFFAAAAATLATEGGMNCHIKAPTGSASGPAQLIDDTAINLIAQARRGTPNLLQPDVSKLQLNQGGVLSAADLDSLKQNCGMALTLMFQNLGIDRRALDHSVRLDPAAQTLWEEIKQQPASFKFTHFFGPSNGKRVLQEWAALRTFEGQQYTQLRKSMPEDQARAQAHVLAEKQGLLVAQRLAADNAKHGFAGVIDRNGWVFRESTPKVDVKGQPVYGKDGKQLKAYGALLPFQNAVQAMMDMNNKQAADWAAVFDRDPWTGRTVTVSEQDAQQMAQRSAYRPVPPAYHIAHKDVKIAQAKAGPKASAKTLATAHKAAPATHKQVLAAAHSAQGKPVHQASVKPAHPYKVRVASTKARLSKKLG